MRLIEVDALKETLDRIPARSIENADGRAYVLIRLSTVLEIIKQMPSVDQEKRMEERTETHACDCISRQAAIDAMVNELSYLPITTEKAYEIAEVLNDLPSAQPEQQWIPCSERLPAVPVCRCLITRDDGRGRVTVEEALFSFSRWYSNEHLEDGRNRKFDISASVIAWAPFPAPYRGGDSE